jgi:N-acetylglucosamine-6-sulfatase
MAGKPASWRNEFVYFYTWEWEAPQTPTIFALRTEQYSFIKTRGVWDRYEIYDILKDPRQKNNLLAKVYNGYKYGVMARHIADPALKKLYNDLDGRLAAEMKRLGLRDVPSYSASP